jgi:hypothetical protein
MSDVTTVPAETLTDDELTALALAADPDAPLTADAQPWQPERDQALPLSYLPQPSVRSRPASRVRTVTAMVIIAAFLAITALGFCATYGQLLPA